VDEQNAIGVAVIIEGVFNKSGDYGGDLIRYKGACEF
jgi:hypothetical protein